MTAAGVINKLLSLCVCKSTDPGARLLAGFKSWLYHLPAEYLAVNFPEAQFSVKCRYLLGVLSSRCQDYQSSELFYVNCLECYLVHCNHYSIISNFCHHVWKGQWRPNTSHTPPLVLPPAIIFKSRLVWHWRLIYYLFWVHNMWLNKSHFCNLSHTCSMGTQLIVQNKKIVVFFYSACDLIMPICLKYTWTTIHTDHCH